MKIIKVIDGDSLVAKEIGTEKRFEIRLWGIDAPEWKQKKSIEAKMHLYRQVYGKVADVEKKGYDKYHRLLAIVHLDHRESINKKMVYDGYAWVYTRYCNATICNEWQVAERKARNTKRGIWEGTDPMSPWVWKKLYKNR